MTINQHMEQTQTSGTLAVSRHCIWVLGFGFGVASVEGFVTALWSRVYGVVCKA